MQKLFKIEGVTEEVGATVMGSRRVARVTPSSVEDRFGGRGRSLCLPVETVKGELFLDLLSYLSDRLSACRDWPDRLKEVVSVDTNGF